MLNGLTCLDTMPRIGATPFAFPDFHGATSAWSTSFGAYFVLYLATIACSSRDKQVAGLLVLVQTSFLHGAIWHPSYHSPHSISALFVALFELLSLWFLAGFLEPFTETGGHRPLRRVGSGNRSGRRSAVCGRPAMGHPIDQIPMFAALAHLLGCWLDWISLWRTCSS